MPKVSVVVPVYYNEGSLAILHERLVQCARQASSYSFEFIFVDDGSGDGSFKVLEQLSRVDNRVQVVKLVRNFGSTMAILAGLNHATGDAVAVISADLQDPPEIILEMLPRWENGTRMVLAAREERDDPLSTRLPAELFNFLFRRFALKNYPPGGFDCFLIDRQVKNVVIQCSEKNTHLPGLLIWTGFEFDVIYYHRQERQHGKSRWNFRRKLKYFADAFTAFSYLPIRLCSLLGTILALLGLLYTFIVLLLSLTGHIRVEGWSSLMMVVLITAGVQLLMLGVVGEYLWRNFDQTRHRPPYLVDRVLKSSDPTEDLKISSSYKEPDNSTLFTS
ncbi:MAG TPA: glycosyltransferase family 2 protein [Chloroflexia bacterium]|nr:glycosyltransferase family 2 protein [Chloroflexia bacterium]